MIDGNSSLIEPDEASPPQQFVQQQHPDHQSWHAAARTESGERPVRRSRRFGWMFELLSDPVLAGDQAREMGQI